MTAKKKSQKKLAGDDYWQFAYGKRHFKLLLDRVLFLRFLKNIRGRFWGLTAIFGLLIGFTICFLIRPDMIQPSTAFSDFGNDVRTAPYFAGSVFFAAYGLWRWRKYLSHTWKRTMPVTGLMALTIIGLYLVALMPISWEPVYRVHIFGFALAGFSMLATVILDSVLSYSRKTSRRAQWFLVRLVAFISIVTGGWITWGSADIIGWYDIALIGESLMLFGYFLWICARTYVGQGRRTLVSKFLKDFVFVD